MQLADDSVIVLDLAERLVGSTWPYLADTRARLFPGALPPGFPLELPLPPGSRLLGSAARPKSTTPGAPATGDGIDVVVEAPGAASDIAGWFEQALAGQAWRPAPAQEPLTRGFQQTPLPSSRTYCRGERGPWLAVVVRPQADGPHEVRIYVDTARPGPCGLQRGPLGRPAIASLLPALRAPQGVTWSPTGGGGSEDRWTSEAVAETELPAGELEAEVSRQLAAAGWTRQDGRADGPVAWSRWRVPSADGHQGFVFVFELPGPALRWLYVQVVSARIQVRRGAFGGWVMGSGWVAS